MNSFQYGFYDELSKIASHRRLRYAKRHKKTASLTLGTIAGLGALSHLGVNTAVKKFHHTKPMRRMREDQLATGLSRAITGAPQSTKAGFGKVLIGPEMWANQDAGAALRPMLSKMSRRQQYKWLKKLRRAVQQDPKLAKLPLFEDAPGAINQLFKQPLPKTNSQAHVKQSLVAKAAPYVTAGALGWAEPSTAIHSAINVGRTAAANSSFGKKFFRNQAKGAAEAIGEGKNPLPPIRTAAMDYGLSPRALDSARITAGLADVDPRTLRRLIGLGMPLGNIPAVQAAAQDMANRFNPGVAGAKINAVANAAANNPQATQAAQATINPALQQVITRLTPPEETARFIGGVANQAGTIFQRPIETVMGKIQQQQQQPVDPTFPKAASAALT